VALAVCALLLAAGSAGCESLQRKFVRKKKKPAERPTPIIAFVDYSQAMTPLERYRKHYLMFDYWNAELLDALKRTPINPKKIQRTSQESLNELEVMRELLQDHVGQGLDALIDERTRFNAQVQSSPRAPGLPQIVLHELERQTRDVHRGFTWRDVEDDLKPYDDPPTAAP